MKVQVLLYDDFCDFEIVFALTMMRGNEIETIALEDRTYLSEAQLKVVPDRTIGQVEPGAADLLIIPGGSPAKFLERLGEVKEVDMLYDHMRKLESNGSWIGAICGGPEFLSLAGMLDGRYYTHEFADKDHLASSGGTYIDEPLVVDDHLITAKGNAYLDFAIGLMDCLALFKDEADRQETIDWFNGD